MAIGVNGFTEHPRGTSTDPRPKFRWAFEHDYPDYDIRIEKKAPDGLHLQHDFHTVSGGETGLAWQRDLETGEYRWLVRGWDQVSDVEVVYGVTDWGHFEITTGP